jgi:hypothetical protein
MTAPRAWRRNVAATVRTRRKAGSAGSAAHHFFCGGRSVQVP